jgi:hypothetical protein
MRWEIAKIDSTKREVWHAYSEGSTEGRWKWISFQPLSSDPLVHLDWVNGLNGEGWWEGGKVVTYEGTLSHPQPQKLGGDLQILCRIESF